MGSFGAMVNSVPYKHDARLFVMLFDTVPHIGCTDVLMGSENLFDGPCASDF
jgi:hypothetical protein